MSRSVSVSSDGNKVATLVLVPTKFELELFVPLLNLPDDVRIECCGFGVAVSGVAAMHMLTRHRPDDVVLIGVAGSLDPALAIGTATAFSSVSMDGIGAGLGSDHQSAESMGWKFWDGDRSEIETTISLAGPIQPPRPQELLTVCSASATASEADLRRAGFHGAVAEDMESFAVAAACLFAEVPLSVVRGISNVAGDRDKARWKIPEAIDAVAIELRDVFEQRGSRPS